MKKFFHGFPRVNASIVLVQHMIKCANKSLCDSLDRLTAMDVRIACHGETMKPGVVYFAPSDTHLKLTNNRIIQLVDSPKVCFVRPAVDVTMKSVIKTPGDNLTGVIMTGMGKDGKEGMSHIKSIGGATLAQDENTSVIWGMPMEAINTGNVDYVLSPGGIRDKLISQAGRLSV